MATRKKDNDDPLSILEPKLKINKVLVKNGFGKISYEKGVTFNKKPLERLILEVYTFEGGSESRSRGVGSGIKGVIGMHMESYSVHNPTITWDIDTAEKAVGIYMLIPKNFEDFKSGTFTFQSQYKLLEKTIGINGLEEMFGITDEIKLKWKEHKTGIKKKSLEEMINIAAVAKFSNEEKFGRVSLPIRLPWNNDIFDFNGTYIMGELKTVNLPMSHYHAGGLQEGEKNYASDKNAKSFELLTKAYQKGLEENLFNANLLKKI